jgi:hypothetical protein
MDKNNRWNLTWEEFEKLFSNKWIRDTKMEAMYTNQDELKEVIQKFSQLKKEIEEIRKYIMQSCLLPLSVLYLSMDSHVQMKM